MNFKRAIKVIVSASARGGSWLEPDRARKQVVFPFGREAGSTLLCRRCHRHRLAPRRRSMAFSGTGGGGGGGGHGRLISLRSLCFIMKNENGFSLGEVNVECPFVRGAFLSHWIVVRLIAGGFNDMSSPFRSCDGYYSYHHAPDGTVSKEYQLFPVLNNI